MERSGALTLLDTPGRDRAGVFLNPCAPTSCDEFTPYPDSPYLYSYIYSLLLSYILSTLYTLSSLYSLSYIYLKKERGKGY